MLTTIRKLFFRLVSDEFILQEFMDNQMILNDHLYSSLDDEMDIIEYLDEFIFPEMQRRGI